jgi:hypothetical protein
VFKKFVFNRFFFFKNKNNNWCKCKLSGLTGLFLSIIFLNIENKFSNAGYHSNKIINSEGIGVEEFKLLLNNSIK